MQCIAVYFSVLQCIKLCAASAMPSIFWFLFCVNQTRLFYTCVSVNFIGQFRCSLLLVSFGQPVGAGSVVPAIDGTLLVPLFSRSLFWVFFRVNWSLFRVSFVGFFYVRK